MIIWSGPSARIVGSNGGLQATVGSGPRKMRKPPHARAATLKALFMEWVPRSAFARGDRFSLDLELDVGNSASRSLSV